VELKARFDEENNMSGQGARAGGVHVVYASSGLKTHAKIALSSAGRRTRSGATSTSGG